MLVAVFFVRFAPDKSLGTGIWWANSRPHSGDVTGFFCQQNNGNVAIVHFRAVTRAMRMLNPRDGSFRFQPKVNHVLSATIVFKLVSLKCQRAPHFRRKNKWRGSGIQVSVVQTSRESSRFGHARE
jgi:hypothetical protein